MVRPSTLQLGYSARDLTGHHYIPSHSPSPFTSPVEASFRLDVAAEAPVPDLVRSELSPAPDLIPSQALHPPLPSPSHNYATFPRAARAHLNVSAPAPLPSGVAFGGVGMVRSVSQPVLTGAEHAQYTAHRAASLGRVAARYYNRTGGETERTSCRARGGRRRPGLPDFGLGQISDPDDSDDDGEVDIEMAVASDAPEVHQSHNHSLHTHSHSAFAHPSTLANAHPSSYTSHARSYNPTETYRTHAPPHTSHRDAPDAQTHSDSYHGPTYNLSLGRAPSATASVTQTRRGQRSVTPEHDTLSRYPRRTPSPGSSQNPFSPSRLLPASRRCHRVNGSPTPSTASRAAWRTCVRYVPWVKVEEAA